MRKLTSLVALIASVAASPAPAAPTSVAEVQARIAVIGRDSSDRSSPQKAVQSFFLWLNNNEEMVCLDTLVRELEKTPSRDSVLKQRNAIRDAFFTDLPVKVFNRFGNEKYEECMGERQSFSYEIFGVEPTGTDKSVITLVAKNTTPLRPGMKPEQYDIKQRRDGTRFRFTLVSQGVGWKISQIEEFSTITDDWSELYKPSDLEELVPSSVFLSIL